MGVEHTQPEKGRKLVIDIGGGSTEMVIGEDFEPLLVESRRMGCVSFAQQFFPGGEISKNNFRRARLAAAQSWKIWHGNTGSKAGNMRWVRLAPLKPPMKSWSKWAKKTV